MRQVALRSRFSSGAAHYVVLVCLGGIVAANFGFDWLRRFDFEQTKRALTETTYQLKENVARELAAVDVLHASLQDRFTEVDRLIQGVEVLFKAKVASGSAVQEALAQVDDHTTPGGIAEGESGTAQGETSEGPLVFRMCVDDMEAKFAEVGADPYLQANYGDVTDPALWNTVDLLSRGEREFGAMLSEEQRESLSHEIEVLRQTCHAAFSHYQAEKAEALVERLAAADYDLPDEKGKFPDLEIPADEIFAFGQLGQGRFVWEKSKYPEMYRWNSLYKYVPLVMLERVRSAYKEGSSQ